MSCVPKVFFAIKAHGPNSCINRANTGAAALLHFKCNAGLASGEVSDLVLPFGHHWTSQKCFNIATGSFGHGERIASDDHSEALAAVLLGGP